MEGFQKQSSGVLKKKITSCFLFLTLNKYLPIGAVWNLNPFLANVLILYPPKTLENL